MLFTVYAKLLYFFRDFWPFIILATVFFLLFVFGIYFVFKSRTSENKKKALLVFITFLCFSVFVFTGFEAYFRYRFDESDSLGFLKVTGKWYERHVVANNYQYRDRDFSQEKKAGVTRIGIVGDSMTFGYGIKKPENRFSNLLEKKLLDSGRNVEVYNLGKSGYDTWNEIGEFQKIKHLKFDIVIWQYFLNDAEPPKSRGTPVLERERVQGKLARVITDSSYFFDYIYWRLESRYEKTFNELRNADIAAYHDPKNFAEHQKKVAEFASLLKGDDRKVIVIVFPFFKFLPDNPLSDMYPKILQMFKDNELPVIDLYQDMKTKNAKDILVSRYDYHPNELVQIIIADRLYDTIAPMIPASKK